MSAGRTPDWYDFLQLNHQNYMSALGRLGKTIREDGPLDVKTTHLVQLAGAAAIRAESAVQSHVRQALDTGATEEEIEHAIKLLTSTIGFPAVAAALSWTEEVFEDRRTH